ncbi:hypothetical protein [Desulfatitalea alkaliphila]|uniref:Nucleotidyltransferase family protein n=1 Tax=Desulfatitalea alkaliphila TaxID=2929485 RepID=A0AA41R8L2_9BACT|nr:hypothetical protein [Desulfatitalea alkaliphila]MCJ8503020.1 hypothetical protein [Desulfatitalea alkaliphila]
MNPTNPHLQNVVTQLCDTLTKAAIPHAMIGAMALGFYGIPRYTADIDLISDARHIESLLSSMQNLGYHCYHQTDFFAQFEALDPKAGQVDFLLMQTAEGRAMLSDSVIIQDEMLGRIPVVQPTDYAILKLMAMANNRDRRMHDGADLSTLIKADAAGLIHHAFTPLNLERIRQFAQRFGMTQLLSPLLP